MLISVWMLLVVVAVAGLLARSVNSRRQCVIVAAALAPWLMAVAVPAVVLAVVVRSWAACGASLVVLGYTLYRNVWPYPTGTAAWFPIVSGIWLAVVVVAVLFAPGTARRLGAALAAREGIVAPGTEDAAAPSLATARDETT